MNWTQCTPALPDMLCLSRQVPVRTTESLHLWSDLSNSPLPRTRTLSKSHALKSRIRTNGFFLKISKTTYETRERTRS